MSFLTRISLDDPRALLELAKQSLFVVLEKFYPYCLKFA